MLKQFKTAVLAAIAIVLSATMASCSNEDLDPNKGKRLPMSPLLG